MKFSLKEHNQPLLALLALFTGLKKVSNKKCPAAYLWQIDLSSCASGSGEKVLTWELDSQVFEELTVLYPCFRFSVSNVLNLLIQT